MAAIKFTIPRTSGAADMEDIMLTINQHEYDLKMTFKALKEFGVVAGDPQASIEKLGSLYTGVLLGDVFALVRALTAMTGKKEIEVQTDLENDNDLKEAFQTVTDFLENSALTKQLVAKFAPMMKKELSKVLKN